MDMKVVLGMLKGQYKIGDTWININQFEELYIKLVYPLKISTEISVDMKMKYIEQIEFNGVEDLIGVIYGVVFNDNYLNRLSCFGIDVKEIKKWNRDDIEKARDKASVKLILAIIWLKGQNNSFLYKHLTPLRECLGGLNYRKEYACFITVLNTIGKVDVIYPNRNMSIIRC